MKTQQYLPFQVHKAIARERINRDSLIIRISQQERTKVWKESFWPEERVHAFTSSR
jgi:hypothetical protein